MKYVVEVTETLVKHVIVEAKSTEEAEDKVSDAHITLNLRLNTV